MCDGRILLIQDVKNRLPHRIGCRNIGIADREVKYILAANLRCAPVSKFKQLTDGGALLAKGQDRWVQHIGKTSWDKPSYSFIIAQRQREKKSQFAKRAQIWYNGDNKGGIP